MKRIQLAILSLAVGFVVCAPGQVRADCTSHGFRHSSPMEQHSDRDANQAFLARLAESADRGVMATLKRWFAFGGESRIRPASPFCPPCQQVPFQPGNRCYGPGCSGDPAPATTPLSAPIVDSHESIGILAAASQNPGDHTARRSVELGVFPSSIFTDSIFHPPRSH